MVTLIKRLDDRAKLPTRAHQHDAGLDLYCVDDFGIGAFDSKLVSTGVAVAIRPKYVGLVRARSGLSVRHNIEVGAGVIDCGYTGEILVHLYNHGDVAVKFSAGDKIAQLVIVPCLTEPVMETPDLPCYSGRYDNGFGSTDAK